MTDQVDLPTEIWLEVLSRLDYYDLKRCMRVSKTFRTLTQSTILDKTMFRSKDITSVDETIIPADVDLHPAFEIVSFECATKIEHAYFFVEDYDEPVPITETSAAVEHATNPPVSVLRLQIHSWAPFEVKNKKGVTVLQVMKALCRFFAKGDHRESMGDHTGWTGWDEVRVDNKGRLLLQAMWFDS